MTCTTAIVTPKEGIPPLLFSSSFISVCICVFGEGGMPRCTSVKLHWYGCTRICLFPGQSPVHPGNIRACCSHTLSDVGQQQEIPGPVQRHQGQNSEHNMQLNNDLGWQEDK
eukprot:scpid101621/ scgid11910/ 